MNNLGTYLQECALASNENVESGLHSYVQSQPSVSLFIKQNDFVKQLFRRIKYTSFILCLSQRVRLGCPHWGWFLRLVGNLQRPSWLKQRPLVSGKWLVWSPGAFLYLCLILLSRYPAWILDFSTCCPDCISSLFITWLLKLLFQDSTLVSVKMCSILQAMLNELIGSYPLPVLKPGYQWSSNKLRLSAQPHCFYRVTPACHRQARVNKTPFM